MERNFFNKREAKILKNYTHNSQKLRLLRDDRKLPYLDLFHLGLAQLLENSYLLL